MGLVEVSGLSDLFKSAASAVCSGPMRCPVVAVPAMHQLQAAEPDSLRRMHANHPEKITRACRVCTAGPYHMETYCHPVRTSTYFGCTRKVLRSGKTVTLERRASSLSSCRSPATTLWGLSSTWSPAALPSPSPFCSVPELTRFRHGVTRFAAWQTG